MNTAVAIVLGFLAVAILLAGIALVVTIIALLDAYFGEGAGLSGIVFVVLWAAASVVAWEWRRQK